jgi:hypothetical protein
VNLRLAIGISLVALLGCKPGEGLHSPARKQWKDKTITAITETSRNPTWITNELRRMAAIPSTDGHSDHYLSPKLILLKNGEWLAYANKCRKEDRRIHDIFIARGSDGKWYYSTYHFCIDMIVLRIDPQPESLSQFEQTYFLRTFIEGTDDCLAKTWPPAHR